MAYEDPGQPFGDAGSQEHSGDVAVGWQDVDQDGLYHWDEQTSHPSVAACEADHEPSSN